MTRHGLTRRDTLASVVSGAAVLGMPGALFAQTPGPTAPVDTTSGKVRGLRVGTNANFLGIPYGGDTTLRRFQPPVKPTPWVGVRDCFALGHQAPQTSTAPNAATGPNPDMGSDYVKQVMAAGRQGMEVGNEGEDCLVLNVYTPDATPARKRPVMVWLHGGGFSIGSAGDTQYDGNALCKRGDVVVVGINHRLGALGYLYLGALSDDFADSGNSGQLDILLALQWVRDNIVQFGGDPGNVTIFGESGGGSKVSTVMAMPAAKGLFHKAIIQSGAGLLMSDKADAVAHAERTLARLGVKPGDVHKLLTMDAAKIGAAGAAAAAVRGGGRLLSPVVDGRTLPRHPFTPDAPEVSRDVPLLIGTTRTEAALFMAADPLFGKYTEAQARERVGQMLGAKANSVYDAFKALRPGWSPTYLVAAASTAQAAWINSIRLAERKLDQHAAPVFMYRLDWEAPFHGGALKSPHGLDTPLVFDNPYSRALMNGTGPEPKKVAAVMSQAWVNFARTGNPSQRGLEWPSYTTDTRKTMIFNVASKVVADPDAPARVLLSS